jgi:hypothetical protein
VTGRPPGSRARSRLLGRKVRPDAPAVAPAKITPQPDLPALAKEIWLKDVTSLPGGLKAPDARAWGLRCRSVALAEEMMTRAEAAVRDSKGQGDKIPQTLWAAVKLAKLATDLGRPFGVSPGDRQRLHVEPDREEDELERFHREHPRS